MSSKIAIFGLVLILGATLFPFNFSFEHRSLRSSFSLDSPIKSRGNDLLIGVDAKLGQTFKGSIDEIRIYRRALTAGEIAQDASAYVGAAEEQPMRDLVAAYSFDESSATIVEDRSGNGNHGSIVNQPESIAGRRGRAVKFIPPHQYVRVPNSPTVDVSGEGITISLGIALDEQAGPTDQVILAKPWRSNSMAYPTYQYAVEFDANGDKSVDFYFGDANGRLRGPFSIKSPLGVWTHLAFAYDGKIVRGYVDGREQLSAGLTDQWEFDDLIVNLILFVPFGFGLGALLGDKGYSAATAVLAVFVIGSALSLGVEILQSWLPGRYSSFVDVATNAIGAVAGAAWFFIGRFRHKRRSTTTTST